MPSVDVLVEDQHVITCFLKDLYPDLPLFLLGHSFGSMIARLYLGSYDHEIVGLIMTGTPPSYVRGITLGKAFVRLLMLLFTPHGYGMISTKLTTSANLKWVCSDPEVVKERLHDPYRKKTSSINCNLFIPFLMPYSASMTGPFFIQPRVIFPSSRSPGRMIIPGGSEAWLIQNNP